MKKRSKEILDLLGRRENDHTISTLAAKFEVFQNARFVMILKISMTTSKEQEEIKPIRLEVTA